MSRLAKLAGLPAVTAYLVAGILIGPFVLGRVGVPGLGFSTLEQVKSLGLISDVAMGFIAFSIGNEFRLSQLRHNGKQATVIGVLQAVAATLLVDAVLIGVHFIVPDKLSIPAAITLGAIAAATAPAATLMVVRQYKAEGPLTSILLPIVALDDAVGLVIFSVSFGVAGSLQGGAVDVLSVAVTPIIEIVLSLALGLLMGFLFNLTEKFFHSRSKRTAISVTFVLLTVALTKIEFMIGPVKIGFSSLLACMMLGTVFCNVCDVSEELMDRTERWTAPLYILFFVFSGAELDFGVIADLAVIAVGLVYIVSRSAGKYLGARSSAKLMKCEPDIVKYLGITLLPQAGVALGMSVMAESLGADGVVIRNVILFSVLIYELIGPTMTKIALTKAGEIVPGAESARGKRDMKSKGRKESGEVK
ncbi:MAG: cation:proton antiporter [Clostridia bacterium]|nr:cation:proton antiporter [Clostridia bacterium]MBQ6678072.1 cation:proton antiporter [Clostridia bacterium]